MVKGRFIKNLRENINVTKYVMVKVCKDLLFRIYLTLDPTIKFKILSDMLDCLSVN